MRRTRALLALVVFMAVPLAGCERQPTDEGIPTVQGGEGGGSTMPTPSATADVVAAMREWAQCMRNQGFDVPDPYLDPTSGKLTFGFEGPAKGDPMEEQFVMAMEVCEPYEAAYQQIDREPFTDGQMERWRVFTQCMRDHGVEVADPDQSSGLPPFPDPRRYRDQPGVLDQALAACENEHRAARSAS
jgi:hypothetical protein